MKRIGGLAFAPTVVHPPGGAIGEIRAEWCSQLIRRLPENKAPNDEPIVYRLPRAVRGLFQYFNEGKGKLTICGNPAGTLLKGTMEIGAGEPGEGDTVGLRVLSVTTNSVTTGIPSASGAPGYFFLGYQRKEITEAAFETSATNSSARRRNYGSLVRASSVNAGQFTLSTPLDRQYEPKFDGQNYWLRFANVNTFVFTDLTIKDLSIEGDGFLGAGIRANLVHGLTIENVKIKRYFNDGMVISRCRDVTVQDCEIRDIGFNPFTSGNGYGVGVSQSHNVVVRRILGDELRLLVTIYNGSSDVTVEDLKPQRLYSQLADIHGGDCLRITFNRLDFGDFAITAGNATWRRGARDVTFDNCRASVMGSVGSIRNLNLVDCRVGRLVFLNTQPDNGNGLMNATGADLGYTEEAFVSNSILRSTVGTLNDRVVDFPLQFVHSNAPNAATLFGTIGFSGCTLDQAYAQASNGIVTLFRTGEGAPNHVTFESCNLQFSVGGLGSFYAIRGTAFAPTGGETEFVFKNTHFTRFASDDNKLLQGQDDLKFSAVFECCTYTDPDGTDPIEAGNVEDFINGVSATVNPC